MQRGYERQRHRHGSTIGQTPMPVEHIQPGQFYFDACYNPDKTQFLLNAEEKGCRILNGLGMSCTRAWPRWSSGPGKRRRWRPCVRNCCAFWRSRRNEPEKKSSTFKGVS